MNYMTCCAPPFSFQTAKNNDGSTVITRLLMIASVVAGINVASSEIYTSPGVSRFRTDAVWSNANTGSSVASAKNTQITSGAIATVLQQEISAVTRILELMRDNLNLCPSSYLERLLEICDLFEKQKDIESASALSNFAKMLSSARVKLLDESTTAKQWTKIARAIDPEAELRLPRRFVSTPINPTIEIDEDALAASAWVRSVFS